MGLFRLDKKPRCMHNLYSDTWGGCIRGYTHKWNDEHYCTYLSDLTTWKVQKWLFEFRLYRKLYLFHVVNSPFFVYTKRLRLIFVRNLFIYTKKRSASIWVRIRILIWSTFYSRYMTWWGQYIFSAISLQNY